MRVGIVGAGIAGLACAERLSRHGVAAELFDKGTRPGGRLSTLRLETRAWDFGAQFIEPGKGEFATQIERWRQAGVLEAWGAGPPGALVGVPAMASLVEDLRARHPVRFSARVDSITCSASRWVITGPELAAGPFDALVLAVPAEQAAPLLSLHDLHQAREAAAVRSRPCWTVMAAFAEPLPGSAYLRAAGPIAWAARNNSKPGRPGEECWVIQASATWSQRNLERDREAIAQELLGAFERHRGGSPGAVTFLKAHRWRFAESHGHASQPLWNSRIRLGACGDWSIGPRIEDAWQAGTQLAERIVHDLAPVGNEDAAATAK